MRIFLTGGTGFVGSHFINQAMASGHEIYALRRSGSLPRLKLDKQPAWIEGSLDGDYSNDLKGVDVFVHLASHTPNPPYDSLANCSYWNVYASLKLAEQAISVGVKKFVVAGSCFEYGRSADKFEYISPNTPLEPMLSYPISKAEASIGFLGIAREKHLELQLLRIFQVFGEGESEGRLWPSLKAAAISGHNFPMTLGEQVRDFINVSDVAAKFVKALSAPMTPGIPVIRHIASGQPQSILEFSQYWWSHWKASGKLEIGKVPYRHNEMMRIATKVGADDL